MIVNTTPNKYQEELEEEDALRKCTMLMKKVHYRISVCDWVLHKIPKGPWSQSFIILSLIDAHSLIKVTVTNSSNKFF